MPNIRDSRNPAIFTTFDLLNIGDIFVSTGDITYIKLERKNGMSIAFQIGDGIDQYKEDNSINNSTEVLKLKSQIFITSILN